MSTMLSLEYIDDRPFEHVERQIADHGHPILQLPSNSRLYLRHGWAVARHRRYHCHVP